MIQEAVNSALGASASIAGKVQGAQKAEFNNAQAMFKTMSNMEAANRASESLVDAYNKKIMSAHTRLKGDVRRGKVVSGDQNYVDRIKKINDMESFRDNEAKAIFDRNQQINELKRRMRGGK